MNFSSKQLVSYFKCSQCVYSCKSDRALKSRMTKVHKPGILSEDDLIETPSLLELSLEERSVDEHEMESTNENETEA